jgi:hypothetical protein
MNLLGILLKALLSEGALRALAKKTGLNSKQLKKVLPLAVPLLLKMLTKNASDKDGALSLLGALTQHTSKKSMAQQIEEADTDDGAKIIGHILGKESQSSLLSLSGQSGLSQQEVSSVLSGIAPALLSGLSAATASAGSSAGKVDLSDGLDLSDVMAMLGGAKPEPAGLLGGLFGKKPAKEEQKDAGLNGAALLQLLLANK